MLNPVLRFIRSRAQRLAIIVLASVLVAAGCAHQPQPVADNPPGFWMGFVHGLLIICSFIGSLFTDVRIYAFPNSGVWYDLGFVLGASAVLGGGGASSRGDTGKD
jgi:hypothetical protein